MSEPAFQPWDRLPTELKLEVLQYLLVQNSSIIYPMDLGRFVNLTSFIGARNSELAKLSLEACQSPQPYFGLVTDCP